MTRAAEARRLADSLAAALRGDRRIASVTPRAGLVVVQTHVLSPDVWAAVARAAGPRPPAPYRLELVARLGDEGDGADPLATPLRRADLTWTRQGGKPQPPIEIQRPPPDTAPPSSSGLGLGALVLTVASVGGLLLLVTSHRR